MGKKAKQREKRRARAIKAKQAKSREQKNRIASIPAIRKLRIGYISDAFCNRPEADFLPVFFAAADKLVFTTCGISLSPADEVSAIFRDGADEWLDVSSMTDDEAVKAVQKADFDFLVDISVENSAKLNAIMQDGGAAFTETVDKWCYTPFDKNLRYSVTAPMLYRGYPTLGIIGSLFSSDELLPIILDLLLALPDCRLLLHGEDAELVKDDDVGGKLRNMGLGDRILVAGEGEYPYDEVDILLGLAGVHSYSLCRAYNHSVPVVMYETYTQYEPFMADIMAALGQSEWCIGEPAAYKEKVISLLQNQDRVAEFHRTLHHKLQNSVLLDLDAYITDLEQDFLKKFYSRYRRDVEKDRQLAEQAQTEKDWDKMLPLLVAVQSVKAKNLPDVCLSLTWGYYFKEDPLRALYWAKKTEENYSEKAITALYLQTKILSKSDNYEAALAAAQHAFALAKEGRPMLPQIKDDLMVLRAGLAYRLGRRETSDYYWQAYENFHDFANRCLCYSAWLMSYNCQEISRQELYEKHIGYNEIFKEIKPYSHTLNRHNHKKLRIGYISPDFRAHVMSHFMWPFLATYNHDNFAVYVYSIGKEDQFTKTFKTLVDRWHDMQSIDYERIAAQIYDDEIDILFDLAGHTSGSGLPVLGYKPAPVQISGLGYMTTTGLREVDYFLTDNYADPPGLNDEYFTEKLLPVTTHLCYTGEDNLPESDYAPCRDRGYVTFGVFNHLSKYTEEMILAWKEILTRLPQAKLLLKCNPLSDRQTVRHLYREWEAKDMPMDRIIFEPSSSDYMKRYLDVDIALDTYPYPGGGTTCDALYMGVPVISRYGRRHSSRFSYSILCQLGLTELTAETVEEYVDKAVALANDGDLLDTFHQKLRPLMKASPLMDVKNYMEEIEGAYRRIWHKYSEEKHDGLC